MQPSSPNVEAFNLICLHLFAELYEEFPVPTVIDPNSLGLSAIPDESEFEATWDVMKIAVETVKFLQEEGFLTFRDQVGTGEFDDVRLTMKGLAILGIPVILVAAESQEPIIRKIKRLAGKGAEKVSADAVQAVVSAVFKFALGATASGTGFTYT
jgi:glutaredoxin-related protein